MSAARVPLLVVLILLLAGCGPGEPPLSNSIAARSATTAGNQVGETANETGKSERALAARRVIRRGELDLEVEDFESLPQQIDAAVQAQGGFIFSSNVSGRRQAETIKSEARWIPSRSGTWTVRVPTERFSSLLDDLRKLGDVRSTKTSAEDVTADYADLESRIRNKQREEERLLKLLADATGRLEEVLTIERELTRVRGEIETAQGRAAMLQDLTDLATLIVTAVEAQPTPPPPPPPLTYLEKLVQAWNASLARLILSLQEASYILVGAIPWLSFPAVGMMAFYVIRRWARARKVAKAV